MSQERDGQRSLLCLIADLDLLNVWPILGVFFLRCSQLSFKFMNRFGNDDLVIADTFRVAFNFTIEAGLSDLLAAIGIKFLRMSNSDTGISIGAPANVEF